MRVEFRLSGSGGQGLLLAGIALAEAAILEGKNATQTQSYGPEARGGASKSEVVISDEEIDYPKAIDPDYLVALTAESFRAFGKSMGDGLVIVDSSVPLSGEVAARIAALPILETASRALGKAVVANMVALGALAGLSGAVSRKSLEEAVSKRVPAGTEELNLRALAAGFDLAAVEDSKRAAREADWPE
jgi:2-oxoglutarate ferredoxin oxidoreductase subunit gamma